VNPPRNANSPAFQESDYLCTGSLAELPMVTQIERDAFNVFVAELPVACPAKNIGNVNAREIHVVLQSGADFLHPVHLRMLISDIPNERACQRAMKHWPWAVEHRPKEKLAARNNVPAVYSVSVFSRDGGLLSYGPDRVDIFRRSASYVDRILRGAKPADLAVQLPTKFVMTLNAKT
jgi:hypothetical protein